MKLVHLLPLLCVSLCMSAQTKQVIKSFPLSDVRLSGGAFYNAQELDKKYLLEMKADRLLAPFLREAGLDAKAESYTNWENTGLDGHIGGHYVSALSLMYASTGDKQIGERLVYMIDELKRCQDANGNGYIGGVPGGEAVWKEVEAGNIRAGGFSLNDKWVPLYNIHKTYAGLRDAWIYTQNEYALEMLIKMTDWAIKLVAQLSEEQIQDMLRSEHGGLNETFADVAAITGDDKYMELAHKFSHRFILEPLLRKEDELTGMHANTQIPKVLGFKRIADLEGNDEWSDASRFFWETVIENRSVSIGGNSAREHFHPANDFSGMISSNEGPETCNTYNMLRLTKMFYETSAEKKYIDYYERALYNHILSSQHPEHGGLVYFTQMRPGHYRVYSQPHTSMWCCVGSGIENHAKYGEMIYAHNDDELYVNLFIPSQLDWKDKKVAVTQENNFPYEAKTKLIINPEKNTDFTLFIRRPDWVNTGDFSVFVNGKKHISVNDNYAAINRTWKAGDLVEVDMPMHVYTEPLPDQSGYYSFFYGPVALAAKIETETLTDLLSNDSRMGHVANGRQIPLKEMPILVSNPEKITECITTVAGKPLTFRINNLYPEQKWGELELIPFYSLHDSRYIIYWPHATAAELSILRAKIEQEEEARNALNAITVDNVACGQQQPESDHFIKFEHSHTGFTDDVHWRDARGWFSYELRNKDAKGKYLYLEYFEGDSGRQFDIFVNDKKLSTVTLEGGSRRIANISLPIPESEAKKDHLTIRFSAKDGSTTAGIIELRLLTSPVK